MLVLVENFKGLGLALLILVGTLSCVKDLEVPRYGDFTPMLIVNGSVSAQRGVSLQVSRLINPQEKTQINDIWISSAIIQFFHKDSLVTDQFSETGNGEYHWNSTAIMEGETYKVTVSHPQYPTAQALVYVPFAPQNVTLDLSGQPVEDAFQEYTVEVQLSYQDPLGTGVQYFRMGAQGDDDHKLIEISEPYLLESESSSFFCNSIYSARGVYYDDGCQPTSADREVVLWLSPVSTAGVVDGQFVTHGFIDFEIETVGPTFRDLAEYLEDLPTEIDLLFTDQHETPSNVEGGFGVVAGRSGVRIKLQL